MDPEIRARVSQAQREGELARLRSVALAEDPTLVGEQLEARVRELEVEKLSAIGRKGAASYRRGRVAIREFNEQRDLLIAEAERLRDDAADSYTQLIARIKNIGSVA